MRAERANTITAAPDAHGDLTIGEVAARAGVRASAIRYYESVGLVPAPRRANGRRVYERAVLDRLAVIRLAREAGFTIAEVRALVGGRDEERSPQARWRPLARRKLGEIERTIRKLELRRRVVERVAACDCATLDECGRVETSCEGRGTRDGDE